MPTFVPGTMIVPTDPAGSENMKTQRVMANINKANKAVKDIIEIAKAYAVVLDNDYIRTDMTIMANRITEHAKAMNEEQTAYDYTEKFYIRSRGVEASEERVAQLGDKVIAVVSIRYFKGTDGYLIGKENRF